MHSRIRLLEAGVRWPAETFVNWKVAGLAARGFDVLVATAPPVEPGPVPPGVRLVRNPHGDPPGRWASLRAAVDVLALALLAPRRLARLVAGIRREAEEHAASRLLWEARRFARLARLRPDVVHFEWPSMAVHYLPLWDVWRCPVVVSCHGSEVSVYPSAIPASPSVVRLPELFTRATAVHVVSQATLHDAVCCGLDPAKAAVILNGVDAGVFSPAQHRRPQGGPLHVVAVGDIHWRRAYEYGLVAIGILVRDGVDVVYEIAGGEPPANHGLAGDLERVEHTITDLDLGQRVRLLGPLPSDGVRDLLRRADVLLHSSLSEGLPTAVLEAMACGLPVVTSDCGGVAEAVRDGVDGFVVPLRDARALAAALHRLAEDPELRSRMGTSAHRRVRESFTLAAQLDGYALLYQRLVTQGER